MVILLCLHEVYEYAVASQISKYFSDEGIISYENDIGTLQEVKKQIRMTNSRCAAKCLADLSCNAIELCSTPSGQTCRLDRGWKNTRGTMSQSTCRQFQIVGIIQFKITWKCLSYFNIVWSDLKWHYFLEKKIRSNCIFLRFWYEFWMLMCFTQIKWIKT